jgi:lysine-N-methylase
MITKLFKQGIDFKCIGSRCIDSCCTGWDISIDKATFESLSKDLKFNKTMDQYAYINEDKPIPNINHGILNLNDHNRCPFLDLDDLCKIQKTTDEDSLSNVCALYPRYYNLVDGIYEESLSFACIEATEKLLLGDPLELMEIERAPKRNVIMQNVKTESDDSNTSSIQYLYDFRKLVFRFLKSEHYSFDEKLGMLMDFHEYVESLDSNQLKIALASYDFDGRKTSLGINLNTYNKIISFLEKVGLSGHLKLDNLINKCIKHSNFESLVLKKLAAIDKVLSNYLIHQMFKDLYPFINMQSKMDSFQYLLKKVQILRVLIAYDGCSDDKRAVRIIQMFSKGLEHHGAFHYELDELVL